MLVTHFLHKFFEFETGAVYYIYWAVDFTLFHEFTLYIDSSLAVVLDMLTYCCIWLYRKFCPMIAWVYFLCFLVLMVLNDHILELVFLIRAWTLPQREIHAVITRDIYLKCSKLNRNNMHTSHKEISLFVWF